MARLHPLIVVGAFAIAVGCAAKGGGGAGGSPTPTGTGTTPSPTPSLDPSAPKYHEDVQPIVYDHCQMCHTAGGVAGAPPIDVYSGAQAYASAMDSYTAQRLMPPWPPEPSCRTDYKNARLLSSTDVQTIHDWYMGGSQEGNPANAPTPTPTPSPLPSPSVVLDAGSSGNFTFGNPGDPSDRYECFRFHTGIAAGTTADMIRAQVTPGNRAVVHHIILYREPTGSTQPEGDMGSCGGVPSSPGGASNPDVFLVGWVPGAAPLEFPADTGMQLGDTDAIVMQVHYHNAGTPETDHSTAALWFSASPVTNIARVIWAGTLLIDVPKGTADYTPGKRTCTIPTASGGGSATVTLLGLAPHMHTHGTKFHSDMISGGTTSCLMDIKTWNFEWQGGYMFQTPLTLHSGDKITTQCDYQNVDGSSDITFGEGTGNEMCFDFLYMVGFPSSNQFYCVN